MRISVRLVPAGCDPACLESACLRWVPVILHEMQDCGRMDAAALGELARDFAAALWFKGRMPPREGGARGTNLAHPTPICSICCLRASLGDGLPRAVIN